MVAGIQRARFSRERPLPPVGRQYLTAKVTEALVLRKQAEMVTLSRCGSLHECERDRPSRSHPFRAGSRWDGPSYRRICACKRDPPSLQCMNRRAEGASSATRSTSIFVRHARGVSARPSPFAPKPGAFPLWSSIEASRPWITRCPNHNCWRPAPAF